NEIKYFKNGGRGSSYRLKTAEFSLMVAKKINDVTPFYERNDSMEVVSILLQSEDEYRRKDVAKMLNVITRNLHRKANLTDEYKEYLQKRVKNTTWELEPNESSKR